MKANDDQPDLDALLADDDLLDQAVAEAQLDAARRHHLLGEPLVIWRDGRVVIVPADEIPRLLAEPSESSE